MVLTVMSHSTGRMVMSQHGLLFLAPSQSQCCFLDSSAEVLLGRHREDDPLTQAGTQALSSTRIANDAFEDLQMRTCGRCTQ